MTGENKSVLVADDDADIRAMIASCISMLDLRVYEAADGSQAIDIVDSEEIDLAVLDYMMPGKDGLQVCQHIKNLRGGIYIPVILLTARDGLGDKVRAFSKGADDYLTKPFHYEELQARVRVQLRLRDLNTALLAKNQELETAQKKIVEQERQLVASQLAGTTSHNLGQPLSAILLNCHLLDKLNFSDQRYQQTIAAIKSDSKRMAAILEELKTINANNTSSYYKQTDILSVSDGEILSEIKNGGKA